MNFVMNSIRSSFASTFKVNDPPKLHLLPKHLIQRKNCYKKIHFTNNFSTKIGTDNQK